MQQIRQIITAKINFQIIQAFQILSHSKQQPSLTKKQQAILNIARYYQTTFIKQLPKALYKWHSRTKQKACFSWRQNYACALLGARVLRHRVIRNIHSVNRYFSRWRVNIARRDLKQQKIHNLNYFFIRKLKSYLNTIKNHSQKYQLSGLVKLLYIFTNKIKDNKAHLLITLSQNKQNWQRKYRIFTQLFNIIQTKVYRKPFNKLILSNNRIKKFINLTYKIASNTRRYNLSKVLKLMSKNNPPNKLQNLIGISIKSLLKGIKAVYDRWKIIVQRQKMKNKFKSLMCLQVLNMKLNDHYKQDAFFIWKNTCSNKWMQFCAQRLAKSPRPNIQIALWRMKDLLQQYQFFDVQPNLGIFCCKLINFITKKYQLVMVNALISIQRQSQIKYLSTNQIIHTKSRYLHDSSIQHIQSQQLCSNRQIALKQINQIFSKRLNKLFYRWHNQVIKCKARKLVCQRLCCIIQCKTNLRKQSFFDRSYNFAIDEVTVLLKQKQQFTAQFSKITRDKQESQYRARQMEQEFKQYRLTIDILHTKLNEVIIKQFVNIMVKPFYQQMIQGMDQLKQAYFKLTIIDKIQQ